MIDPHLATELQRYGPDAEPCEPPALDEARAYCRRLAKKHYENFTVASWLLPRSLRPHFYHIYAYCRWADDLADEVGDAEQSLALLRWWRSHLEDCYQGKASHPVFVALRETIDHYGIPPQPFEDLLEAFVRDQRQDRYDTVADVLDYCRCSANPVGRLVLYLAGSHRDENLALSDAVCTGLQLANFCQDVARDWDRGRIYLSRETCQSCGYSESGFAARRADGAFRRVMRVEVERADQSLRCGWPLVQRLSPEVRFQVDLFVRGGLAILEQIRRQDYDVWRARPVLSTWRKLGLVLSATVKRTFLLQDRTP